MIKRTLRIVSLSLLILGLVTADVTLLLGQGIGSESSPVLAQSRKRSKKKKQTVRRQRHRRNTTARRQLRRHTSARRRSRKRTVPLRAGQRIPRDRVLEIQRALMKRGFLKEATGVYDTATVEAMKAFQAAENIAVTGYPTAHALDRLGLSPGPSKASTTSREGVFPDADQPEAP